ncbi:hypothetical protein BC829DRAFT_400216 [Chytridium lagenaria]|nr:hypothetical protein BC829DRAFT_400216 [Chytridium lagenaria]
MSDRKATREDRIIEDDAPPSRGSPMGSFLSSGPSFDQTPFAGHHRFSMDWALEEARRNNEKPFIQELREVIKMRQFQITEDPEVLFDDEVPEEDILSDTPPEGPETSVVPSPSSTTATSDTLLTSPITTEVASTTSFNSLESTTQPVQLPAFMGIMVSLSIILLAVLAALFIFFKRKRDNTSIPMYKVRQNSWDKISPTTQRFSSSPSEAPPVLPPKEYLPTPSPQPSSFVPAPSPLPIFLRSVRETVASPTTMTMPRVISASPTQATVLAPAVGVDPMRRNTTMKTDSSGFSWNTGTSYFNFNVHPYWTGTQDEVQRLTTQADPPAVDDNEEDEEELESVVAVSSGSQRKVTEKSEVEEKLVLPDFGFEEVNAVFEVEKPAEKVLEVEKPVIPVENVLEVEKPKVEIEKGGEEVPVAPVRGASASTDERPGSSLSMLSNVSTTVRTDTEVSVKSVKEPLDS